jgi:hypothetical protein
MNFGMALAYKLPQPYTKTKTQENENKNRNLNHGGCIFYVSCSCGWCSANNILYNKL